MIYKTECGSSDYLTALFSELQKFVTGRPNFDWQIGVSFRTF